MQQRSTLREYLYFNRKERNGILLLLAFSVGVAFLPVKKWVHRPAHEVLDDSLGQQLAALSMQPLPEKDYDRPRHYDGGGHRREVDQWTTPAGYFYFDPNTLDEIDAECICLNLSSVWRYPKALFRLRKLIRTHRPDLVHTHLYWPTVIARLAVPPSVPLVSTLHAFIAEAPEYRKPFIRLLDRHSFGLRPSVLVSVAEGALQEYAGMLGRMPANARVLYNFVDPAFFSLEPVPTPVKKNGFSLVSVGALRQQKNQALLLHALHRLGNEPFTLDLFGSGPLQQPLQDQLRQHPAPVRLMGEHRNIRELLPQYDLFVLSSDYEGFSIAVLEAMALRIPLLLSDIPSFREQCGDTAVYFEKGNAEDCARKIRALSGNAALLKQNSEAAFVRLNSLYTMDKHLSGIRSVYTGCLQSENFK